MPDQWSKLSEMSNPSKDFGSNAQEEDISDDANRGTKRKNSDASEDPPQLGVKLPRMSDIQVPTKLRKHARLPVDILLLTVKECEFLACYMNLNNPFKCWFDDVGFVYLGDENEGQEEKVKVALLRCHEGAGVPGGSIVTTKNAASVLKPKAVILVGTCSSLCPEETKLGDVVIPTKLTTYGLKKVTNERELHDNIRTPASRRFLDLIKDAASGWEAPLKNSEDREVKIHSSGEMLSIPEVINAEWRRKELAETFPQAVAIDSEAEGNEIPVEIAWVRPVIGGWGGGGDAKYALNELKKIGKRSEPSIGLGRGAAAPNTAILSPSQTPVRIALMVFDRRLFHSLFSPLWKLVSGYGDREIPSQNRAKHPGETNLSVVQFLVEL